jgi:hypothetical protein
MNDSTSSRLLKASRDNDVEEDAARSVVRPLFDGGVPPATPLPVSTPRAGGFASLPYDSFAKENCCLARKQNRAPSLLPLLVQS